MFYILILILFLIFIAFLFFKKKRKDKKGIIIYTYSSIEDMINKRPIEIKTIKDGKL